MSRIRRSWWMALLAAGLLVAGAIVASYSLGGQPVQVALASTLTAARQPVSHKIVNETEIQPVTAAAQAVAQAKATPPAPSSQKPSFDGCVACHTNEQVLKQMAVSAPSATTRVKGEDIAGDPEPVEPWKRVLVDPAFLDDVHSESGCTSCHGGTPGTVNFAEAHTGLKAKVSAQPMQTCGTCHIGLVKDARTSQHRMLWGFQQALEERGADFTDPEMVHAYGDQCTRCHADCGDCHISKPAVTGGGLANGHLMQQQDQATDTGSCGDCHNATVDAEYTGAHAGISADVHWQTWKMPCTSCHKADQMHGSAHGSYYDGAPEPSCTDAGCHQKDVQVGGANLQHTIHSSTVQCQVCHASGAYTSCQSCHTGTDSRGKPTFTTGDSELTFKIGRNAQKSEDRPWNYVLVRKSPVTPETFAEYGENLLPKFDDVPTWQMATPHNMQRITPQNSSCNNCHGNEALFLTGNDLSPDELEANQDVIVTKVPAPRAEVPQ